MTEEMSSAEDPQKTIKALEWKIRCAREALGAGEELPRLAYRGGDITVEVGQIVVPLVASRAPAHLFLDPASAVDLIERIGSILHDRRVEAAKAVRVLHFRTGQSERDDIGYCETDGEAWPCQTIIALQGEGDE